MNTPRQDEIAHALIVDEPWISKILRGEKIWELRTTHCQKRGWVGLIRKGSGQVVGVARITGSKGPLTPADLDARRDAHRVPNGFLHTNPEYRYAWELGNAQALRDPVHYTHKLGAVIWVRLDPSVTRAIPDHLGPDFQGFGASNQSQLQEIEMQNTTEHFAGSAIDRRPRSISLGSGGLAAQAEEWLGRRFPMTRKPTKYIAGFDLGAGREVAIERSRQSLMVWIGSIPAGLSGYRIVNRSNPGQPYQPSQDRNSNLRSVAPTLATGHQAYYLELEDLGALERLVAV
jgi:hypothetical protein